MRKHKDGTPEVVHRRCAWADFEPATGSDVRCHLNAEPGQDFCQHHLTADQ
ncbi:hypothetical protein SEA_MILANI_9 [Microbacterium phage Milani]|nr:hypothetical protein SEA_MILANI_9 [Microbacterium phage Milani]